MQSTSSSSTSQTPAPVEGVLRSCAGKPAGRQHPYDGVHEAVEVMSGYILSFPFGLACEISFAAPRVLLEITGADVKNFAAPFPAHRPGPRGHERPSESHHLLLTSGHCGIALDLSWRALGDLAAEVHNDDPFRQAHHHAHVVFNQDHGDGLFGP